MPFATSSGKPILTCAMMQSHESPKGSGNRNKAKASISARLAIRGKRYEHTARVLSLLRGRTRVGHGQRALLYMRRAPGRGRKVHLLVLLAKRTRQRRAGH